jgi:outer membrane autotransporter protein
MLALVACATTSGQALALSSACTTVNSGVYNKTNSVSFSDDLGTGFAAGETVTFVISGTGGTFYVDVDDVNTHTVEHLGIAGYARATDDRSEPGDERFLSRHRRLSRDAPASTSLLNRDNGQSGPTTTGPTTTAALATGTKVASNGFGGAMGLGAGRFDDLESSTAGSQSVQFRTSLSQLRRDAAQSETDKGRMALGAGGAGALPLAYLSPSPWNLWVEGRYSGFNDDKANLGRDGHVGVLYVGGDYLVTRDMIIGALVQFDWAKDSSDVLQSNVDGNGWMAGPYLSARIHENIYLDLRAAWGRSSNDVDVAAATGSFDTSRWLVKGTLAGNWLYGPWRFTPSAELAYIKESADAFANSAGTLVSGQDVALGRLQFGPEIGYRFAHTRDMLIEPFAALKGVWDFDNPNIAIIDGVVVGPGDFWGRLEGGLTVVTASGWNVRGLASWDGVGASDYSGYTLQGTVSVPLN